MGQSAEELRREIADTRGDLSETLDAIGDRVSPGRIAARQKNRVVGGVQSVRDRVMGTAHDAQSSLASTKDGAVDSLHGMPDAVRERTEGAPLVAGALAFGIGFLVAAALPASRPEKQAGATLLEHAEPVKQQLTDAGQELVESIKEPAKEAAQSVKAAAEDGARSVADTAQSAAQDTKQQATEAVDTVASSTPTTPGQS
jgi:ElaB/YqjD/DUF883 family membrane-anchored ribosome-binding protein